MRFVAHGNHSRIGLRDSACFVFVFGDTVNDGSFFIFVPEFPGTINRTNDVDLVILPRFIFVINVNDVVSVVYPEDGVASVPMNVMNIKGMCMLFACFFIKHLLKHNDFYSKQNNDILTQK